MRELTSRQARQFILLKQGLLGERRFTGKQGTMDYVRQAGCIQFDPVDLCGKNAELTCQSRIEQFTKGALDELLYKDRLLFDYPDKNLSILPMEDWPYYERYRKTAREGGLQFEWLAELEDWTKSHIKEHGPVNSDELPLDGKTQWYSSIHWSGAWKGKTNTARSVLEQMYSTGELVIHHKKGARKYYDLAERHVPPPILHAPEPLSDDFEHKKWRVLRRVGAVGLLWNRPSDAWLGIWSLDKNTRDRIFDELRGENKISAIAVEGQKDALYCRTEDVPLVEDVRRGVEPKARCELIAPLDPFLWDRRLIKALFGFEYTWEIYTPPDKRKYGSYVLPLLWGERFVGRVQAVREGKGQLLVKRVWYEEGVRSTKKLQRMVEGCLKRFAKFNGCELVYHG